MQTSEHDYHDLKTRKRDREREREGDPFLKGHPGALLVITPLSTGRTDFNTI